MTNRKNKILIATTVFLLLALAVIAGYRFLLGRSDYYLNRAAQYVKARLAEEATFKSIKLNKNRLIIEGISLTGKSNLMVSHIEVVLGVNPFEGGLGMPREVLIGQVHARVKEKDLPEILSGLRKASSISLQEPGKPKKDQSFLMGLASLRYIRLVKLAGASFIVLDDENNEIGFVKGLTAEGDLQKFHFSTENVAYKNYAKFDKIRGEVIANDDIPRKSIPFLVTLETESQPITIQGDIAKDLGSLKISTKVKNIDFIKNHAELPLVLNDQSELSVVAKVSNILSPKDISLVVNATTRAVGVYHPNLASTPVVFNKISIFSQNRFDRDFTVFKSTVKVTLNGDDKSHKQGGESSEQSVNRQGMSFDIEFAKSRSEGAISLPAYVFELKMDQTPCQNIKNETPPAFTSQLDGFDLIGTVKFAVQFAWVDEKIDEFDFQIKDAAFNCKVIKSPEGYSAERLNSKIPLEGRVANSENKGERSQSGVTSRRNYVPFHLISPKFVAAVIASEDAGFYYHKGFQFQSIVNAMKRNIKEKSVVLGGSTITMQMVKNLFLSPDRTISRKMQEVFLSWHIDSILTKEKIFEIYANIIEYGPDVYGIEQASRLFFGKQPAALNVLESAYIATLLPNPKGRYLYFCRNKVSDNFRVLLNKNLQRMSDLNLISSDELQTALTSKLIFSKFRYVTHDAGCKQGISEDQEDPATMSESFRIDF